ncbi:MAG: cell division protein FtsA [Aquificota bacterium]|nr:cell division protein FtsA [Aquificota bacterium]
MTEEEKESGVLLLDIGAGLTDYVLFAEGYPVFTGSVNIGGLNITKDIAFFMKVEQDEAERTKKEEGVALVDLAREGEILKIKPRGETREVSVEKRQLAEVIQIRLEEIMDKVINEIEEEGFKLDSANAGIVITGGTANLKGIKEFVERFTDLPVRIGYPSGIIGLKERIEDPKYATAVGLLKFAVHPEGLVSEHRTGTGISTNSAGFKHIIEKLKEFLREIL